MVKLDVYERVKRERVNAYLAEIGWREWENVSDENPNVIWVHTTNKDETLAWFRFDVPKSDVPDWGQMCKLGIEDIARFKGVTVLDVLAEFGVLRWSDLFVNLKSVESLSTTVDTS